MDSYWGPCDTSRHVKDCYDARREARFLRGKGRQRPRGSALQDVEISLQLSLPKSLTHSARDFDTWRAAEQTPRACSRTDDHPSTRSACRGPRQTAHAN